MPLPLHIEVGSWASKRLIVYHRTFVEDICNFHVARAAIVHRPGAKQRSVQGGCGSRSAHRVVNLSSSESKMSLTLLIPSPGSINIYQHGVLAKMYQIK